MFAPTTHTVPYRICCHFLSMQEHNVNVLLTPYIYTTCHLLLGSHKSFISPHLTFFFLSFAIGMHYARAYSATVRVHAIYTAQHHHFILKFYDFFFLPEYYYHRTLDGSGIESRNTSLDGQRSPTYISYHNLT